MTPEQKEEFRHTVLAVLVVRHPAALPLAAIRRHVTRQGITLFDDAELHSALHLLKDLGFAQSLNDGLGSGVCWSATAQGVIAHERNGGV